MFPYNNKKYLIDIVEAKPSNGISIIETDCEVDFAPPLDYKEPVAAAAAKGQVKGLLKIISVGVKYFTPSL